MLNKLAMKDIFTTEKEKLSDLNFFEEVSSAECEAVLGGLGLPLAQLAPPKKNLQPPLPKKNPQPPLSQKNPQTPFFLG